MTTHASDRTRQSPVVYAGLLLVAAMVLHIALRASGMPAGSGPRLATTLVLVVAMLAFVAAQVSVLRSQDEFHRQVHISALTIAFPIGLVLLFCIGYLRGEGFLAGRDPRDLWLLLLLPYACGFLASWRRYR
jgi:hypothetical protein